MRWGLSAQSSLLSVDSTQTEGSNTQCQLDCTMLMAIRQQCMLALKAKVT